MLQPEIYEDKLEQKNTNVPLQDLMDDEQLKRGQYYANQYLIRRGEVELMKSEWDELWRLYACERDPDPSDPNLPNSFIPLITPVVEGQVAAMMESTIDFTHVTDNPAHEQYMRQLDEASAWFRRKGNFNLQMKDFARMYEVLGGAWIVPLWEKTHSKKKGVPSGYPRFTVPPIQSVLVDGRIKDYKDLQNAEYIIHEIGYQSIGWARKEYGDDKAEALAAGYNREDGEEPMQSYDDRNSFQLLHVWTRSNEKGNLQLIEMDVNGLILRESDPNKPYYEKVDNEYPFYFARMMPKQGNFYGYGDGKILKPMQYTVNRLTDELELAARFSAQSKVAIDPKGECDVEQFNSDPSKPIMITNPNQNIRELQAGGINPVVVNMIEFTLREAQRATRFADIMTGQSIAASSTATSVNAQIQQGSVGIKDKKTDIAEAMAWADMYGIKMCLQYWKAPFWANVVGERAEFVDMQEMREAPAAKPLSAASVSKMIEDNVPIENLPTFELVEDDDGITTTDFDFSTRVVIGQGIGRGKTEIYNMVIGLVQLGLITPKRAKKLLEDTLGFKLSTDEDDRLEEQQQQATMQQNASQMNPLGNPNVVQKPVQMPAENQMSTPGIGSMDRRVLA